MKSDMAEEFVRHAFFSTKCFSKLQKKNPAIHSLQKERHELHLSSGVLIKVVVNLLKTLVYHN